MVTMWEAKARRGRAGELQRWALTNAPPGSAVYASHDDRVVIIAEAPLELPDVPVELSARPPHAWDFDKIG